MKKRIETNDFVLELKNPEGVKAVAVSCVNESNVTAGVVGGRIHCMVAAQGVLSSLVRSMKDEGAVEEEIKATLSFICKTACGVAVDKETKDISEQVKAKFSIEVLQ